MMRWNYKDVGWFMAVSLLLCGGGVVLLFAILTSERQQHQMKLQQTQAQLVVEQAGRLFDAGDAVGALPWVVAGAEIDNPPAEAVNLLLEMVYSPHVVSINSAFIGRIDSVQQITMRPDFQQVAYIQDGNLWLDDPDGMNPQDTGFSANQLLYSLDGGYLAIIDSQKHQTTIFNVDDMSIHMALDQMVIGLDFSLTGRYMKVTHRMGTDIYDLSTTEIIYHLSDRRFDVVFALDEQSVYVITQTFVGRPVSSITHYRLDDFSVINTFDFWELIRFSIIEPKTQALHFINPFGQILMWSGDLWGTVMTSATDLKPIQYSPDGRYLIFSDPLKNDLVIWDGERFHRLKGYGGEQVLFEADGVHFHIPTQNGLARISLSSLIQPEPNPEIAYHTIYDYGDKFLLMGEGGWTGNTPTGVILYDLQNQEAIWRKDAQIIHTPHLSINEDIWVYFERSSSNMTVHDLTTGDLLEKWKIVGTVDMIHLLSADRLVTKYGDQVTIYDVWTGDIIAQNELENQSPYTRSTYAFDEYDGRILIADSEAVVVWSNDLQDHQIFPHHPERGRSAWAKFDAEGNIRLFYRDILRYQVLDGQTGALIEDMTMPFGGHPYDINLDLAHGLFNIFGEGLKLVDLRTGEMIYSIHLPTQLFNAMMNAEWDRLLVQYADAMIVDIPLLSLDELLDHVYADHYFEPLTCDLLTEHDVSCELLLAEARIVPTLTPLAPMITAVPIGLDDFPAWTPTPPPPTTLPVINPTSTHTQEADNPLS